MAPATAPTRPEANSAQAARSGSKAPSAVISGTPASVSTRSISFAVASSCETRFSMLSVETSRSPSKAASVSRSLITPATVAINPAENSSHAASNWSTEPSAALKSEATVSMAPRIFLAVTSICQTSCCTSWKPTCISAP